MIQGLLLQIRHQQTITQQQKRLAIMCNPSDDDENKTKKTPTRGKAEW